MQIDPTFRHEAMENGAASTHLALPLLRRRRVRILGLALAPVVAFAIFIPAARPAYEATLRREAYLPELARLAQHSPFDGSVQALYAARLAQAGEYTPAAEALQRAVASGENPSLAWLALSASLSASGKKEQAFAALQMALRKSDNPAEIQRVLARFESLPLSVSPAALAETLCPNGPEHLVAVYGSGSWLNGSVSWWGRNHPDQSGFATREQWAARQPANDRVQLLWSDALLRNRRYLEAATTAQRCLDRNPNQPEAHLLLGNCFTSQGASAKAGLQYVAALKQRPGWTPALLGLGQCTLNLKLLGMGVDVYQKAIKAAPNSADAWIGLGIAYYNQRIRFGDSLAAFHRAEKLSPERSDYYADYSNSLRANFKFDEAEGLLRTRLAGATQDARCNYLLALLLEDHNPTPEREQEAEKRLRLALQVEPDQAAAAAQLGKVMLNKNPNEAVALLEKVVKSDLFDTASLMSLAQAYRKAGRPADAEKSQARFRQISHYVARQKYLEDQLRRQPLNVDLHLQLARHYTQGGQSSKAQVAMDAAYMLQVDRARATRALDTLNAASLPAPTVPGK
jgi:tetratricopeptide (TPR) repeat protein